MNFFNQLSQMALKDILALTVIGALVTTIGSFIAMVIKEYFFTRSFESWKEKRSLENVYRKYRDPIILAATELCVILNQICEIYPPPFLRSNILELKPEGQRVNSNQDVSYLKYKFMSSVYRLCSFLGWLELYRQDIVFLDSGKNKTNSKLDANIQNIRDDLADGMLNPHWNTWKDVLIFREEQRAIGETMISTDENAKVVIGYKKFCSLFNPSQQNEQSRWINDTPNGQSQWISVAATFFRDHESRDEDFRLLRIKRLIVHSVDLIELLDSTRLTSDLTKWRAKYKTELGWP